MLRRLAKVLIVLALTASVGLHWAVLQSVAWSTMIASNMRTTTLAQAVELTFDGKHPCCLCKAIAQGRSSERKADSTFVLKKFEFPPTTKVTPITPLACFSPCERGDVFGLVRFAPPPTPPPRFLLV